MSVIALVSPKQARSQATLERIVEATKDLMEEKDWPLITMAEIAERAQSSVGSLYARFPSKQTLLDHLDEDYAQTVIEMCHNWPTGNAKSLDQYLEGLTKQLLKFHRSAPGRIRHLILEARLHQHSNFAARTERMNEALSGLWRPIADYAQQLGHAHPERSAHWAFRTIVTLVREIVLFPESFGTLTKEPNSILAKRIARSASAHLVTNNER